MDLLDWLLGKNMAMMSGINLAYEKRKRRLLGIVLIEVAMLILIIKILFFDLNAIKEGFEILALGLILVITLCGGELVNIWYGYKGSRGI